MMSSCLTMVAASFLSIASITAAWASPLTQSNGVEIVSTSAVYAQSASEEDDLADEYFEKARNHKENGAYEKARKEFQKGLKFRPDDEKALTELAWVHNELKDYRAAVTSSVTALRENTENSDACRELGYAQWKLKKHNDAIGALIAAILCDPTNQSAYDYLIQVYEELGSKKKAKEIRDLKAIVTKRAL